jgi:hypothetical protein
MYPMASLLAATGVNQKPVSEGFRLRRQCQTADWQASVTEGLRLRLHVGCIGSAPQVHQAVGIVLHDARYGSLLAGVRQHFDRQFVQRIGSK